MNARRTDHLRPEGAYQVLARAQQMEAEGQEIIHLEIGQPDFETFANISLAGIRAVAAGRTRYTPPAGTPSLREAIAEDAGRRRGIRVHADEVVVSPGAKPNLFFPTLALVEPGDEVIYPDPGFPTYEAMIRVAGGVPVPVPLREAAGFSFDLEAFDRAVNARTRLVILNSPGNPTGGVIPLADLEHIAAQAQRCGCWVMSDEIYARIAYDGRTVPSIASLPDMQARTIIVDGFSKTYAMTGWRLGFGLMPRELAQRVGLLLTHSIGSTAQFTQDAGVEAITGPQEQVDAVVAEYQRRRDAIVAGLNALPGFRCQKPQGAFYAFPNIQATGKTSGELANLILERGRVALLPGTAFGQYGEGYLRLSYAASLETIQRGLERIRSVLYHKEGTGGCAAVTMNAARPPYFPLLYIWRNIACHSTLPPSAANSPRSTARPSSSITPAAPRSPGRPSNESTATCWNATPTTRAYLPPASPRTPSWTKPTAPWPISTTRPRPRRSSSART
jgi:aspartate/methionine/tyrosine aminotransferase